MALSQKNKQTDKQPKRMITGDTELEREELEKCWKNAVLAKNATNDCLTYIYIYIKKNFMAPFLWMGFN